MNKKKLGLHLISSFIGFFISILLTLSTCLVALYLGFFTKSGILNALNYKDYYSNTEEYFYENAKDYTLPSGLPADILDGVIDEDVVHDDIRGYVEASLAGQQYRFSVEELKQNLTDNIYAYFEAEGQEMSQVQKDTLPEYVQSIADIYVEDLKVPLVHLIPNYKAMLQKIIITVCLVCGVLTAVMAFVMIRMYRWKHRGVRYLIYSTTATAIMVTAPALLLQMSGIYRRINITAKHTYHLLVAYVDNGLKVFYYAAIFWAIVSLGMIALVSYLKRGGQKVTRKRRK